MKKILFVFPVFILCCCFSCKKEKIAIGGSGWNEIAIVDKLSGSIDWSYTLGNDEECNDIEIIPDGNILFAYKKGARLMTKSNEIIWDFKANDNEQIHSASLLPSGNYLIGVCGDKPRIVELDKKGNISKEIFFNALIFDNNRQFRQIAKDNNETYFVPLIEKRKIIQVTQEGHSGKSIYTDSDIFSLKFLTDNNLIISCGKDRMYVIADPDAQKIITTVKNENIKGALLKHVGEIELKKNGNIMIANGNIVDDNSSSPLILELNKENELVWSLPYNSKIKNITTLFSFKE
jgi:hypothetical protein